MRANPTSGNSNSCGYTPAPSTKTGRRASVEGKARASRPKASIATFSAMIPSAIVDSSHTGEPARKNGRTATRSTSRPNSAEAASVATRARASGQPAATWTA
jgi:hypothetical protein